MVAGTVVVVGDVVVGDVVVGVVLVGDVVAGVVVLGHPVVVGLSLLSPGRGEPVGHRASESRAGEGAVEYQLVVRPPLIVQRRRGIHRHAHIGDL